MRTQKVTDCSYSWYYDEINDSSFYDEVTTVNKPTTRYFYDGHGNAQLGRDGSSYSLTTAQSYEPPKSLAESLKGMTKVCPFTDLDSAVGQPKGPE